MEPISGYEDPQDKDTRKANLCGSKGSFCQHCKNWATEDRKLVLFSNEYESYLEMFQNNIN